MNQSCSTTPLSYIRKEIPLSNQNILDSSESSTGESQYKEELNEDKCEKNIDNNNYIKKDGGNKLLSKKVKRFNFLSPNKKQKKNNNNNKNNIINNIFQEFKSSFSQYSKYPQFKIIEKKIKNGLYSSPFEFSKDFRKIFSNLFLASLTPLDSQKYDKILILSQIFEEIFQKYEKNSQIKTAIKLANEEAKIRKEINKFTRKKNPKIGNLGDIQNLVEKKEKSMEDIRENISKKITQLNAEQKRGILNIIDEKLVNKNENNKIIEFNIYNIPIKQLKKLDLYINNCINNNINIKNYKNEIEENINNIIQFDELSNSGSELSDDLDSESD